MRALLVANPRATATTSRMRDVLASALSADLRIDVAPTKGRGHAAELGAIAAEAAYDLVVVLGGDGTVNEVVNGLLVRGPSPDLPAVAVVPGGSTNVFARALGLPNNAVEATGQLLEALREGRSRRIGLGLADDRYFTFNAGLGLDAATVERVEEKRAKGRKATNALYVRSAVNRFYLATARRRPPLEVTGPGLAEPQPVFLALVCNTDPWTYLADRPVRPTPNATFEAGLDVFGLRRLSTVHTLRQLRHLLFPTGAEVSGRHVLSLHDQSELTVTAERPLPFQLDGDALGPRTSVRFRSVPQALRVVV